MNCPPSSFLALDGDSKNYNQLSIKKMKDLILRILIVAVIMGILVAVYLWRTA